MKLRTKIILFLVLTSVYTMAQTDTLIKKLSAQKNLPNSYSKDTLIIVTLNDLARKNLQINKPSVGLSYANEALKKAKIAKWNNGLLLSYANIASIQNISNQHYDAIQTGLSGLALAEKLADRYYEVVFLRSLGNNYDMLDNYEKAIPFYNSCLKKSENFPRAAKMRANCLVELGDAYRIYYKNPTKAKALIEEGINIYKKIDTTGVGYAYDYLGQAYTDLKDYNKAEKIFKLSRIELDKNKKYYLIPELLFHTAQMYLNEKKYDLAKKYAFEGVNYSKKMETVFGESEATKILYLANKASNEPVEALKYYEKYTILRDSLTEKNIEYRFEIVQNEYKTQKQNIQIDQLKIREKNAVIAKQKTTQYFLYILLAFALIGGFFIYKNNRKLRRKNLEITEAMLNGQTIERQRVASDLHDNLGSTLSSIGWSMDAIDKSKMTKNEQEVYTNLQEMISTAYREVRLLSHNLLPEELEKQGLATALSTFVRKLNQNTKTRFDLIIPENFGRFDKKTEFELYSITLELVNNILKHSQATEAKILFEKDNKQLKLSILDNGKGMFENTSDGKGLKNVQARVDSLNGKWVIKSKENEGTDSVVVVPVN
jgi:signal transduction histidine kinase